jgi:hypothetical protein
LCSEGYFSFTSSLSYIPCTNKQSGKVKLWRTKPQESTCNQKVYWLGYAHTYEECIKYKKFKKIILNHRNNSMGILQYSYQTWSSICSEASCCAVIYLWVLSTWYILFVMIYDIRGLVLLNKNFLIMNINFSSRRLVLVKWCIVWIY